MIIPSRHRKMTEWRIVLPDFIRAPLALRNGTPTYSVIDKNLSRRGRLIELSTTFINPKYWNSLWRIEITTEDALGITATICELLENRGIEVINLESSVNWNPAYHSTNLFISTQNYFSEIDGSPLDRQQSNIQELKGLEWAIIAEFGDQIAIPNYKMTPLLRIRRSNSMKRLADQLGGPTGVPSKKSMPILNGGMELTTAIINTIRNALKMKSDEAPNHVYYCSSVDTKTKIIRTAIYSNSDARKFGLTAFLSSNQFPQLSILTRALADEGLNIIQQQFRQTTKEEFDRAREDFKFNPDHFDKSLRRYDFLVERELDAELDANFDFIKNRILNRVSEMSSSMKVEFFLNIYDRSAIDEVL